MSEHKELQFFLAIVNIFFVIYFIYELTHDSGIFVLVDCIVIAMNAACGFTMLSMAIRK